MILIYTDNITARLKYAFNLVFGNILGIEISFTDNKDDYLKAGTPKLYYSNQKPDFEISKNDNNQNGLFIYASDLLFETEIKPQNIVVFDYEDQKVMFPTNNFSLLPFDPFASIFYIVTRYEEYLPFDADIHNRFTSCNSILSKNDILDKPIVNIWALLLLKKIKEYYPEIESANRKFQFISTIDIDNAYAFKYKGFIRTIAGLAKSFFYNFKEIKSRVSTISGYKNDKYDTYLYIENSHKKYNLKPIFFFLIGKYGKYDKNLSSNNNNFRKLIFELAGKYNIGLHPSYISNNNFNSLAKEKKDLSEIVNKEITKSRMHFIKLKFPDTYKNLIQINIREDYTMGFPEICGFRAGICTPFKFYNLSDEIETNLTVFPFQIMDLTLNKYMKLSPSDAINYIESIINRIKEVNGTFISIWHNESLCEAGIWKNWRMVYEKMLELAEK